MNDYKVIQNLIKKINRFYDMLNIKYKFYQRNIEKVYKDRGRRRNVKGKSRREIKF